MFTSDDAPGYRWAGGQCLFRRHETILPPNSSICVFGNSGSISAHLFPGIWTATSEHPGGVQVAMADGSARFYQQQHRLRQPGRHRAIVRLGFAESLRRVGRLGSKSGGDGVGDF